jgi:hypothetical protein
LGNFRDKNNTIEKSVAKIIDNSASAPRISSHRSPPVCV